MDKNDPSSVNVITYRYYRVFLCVHVRVCVRLRLITFPEWNTCSEWGRGRSVWGWWAEVELLLKVKRRQQGGKQTLFLIVFFFLLSSCLWQKCNVGVWCVWWWWGGDGTKDSIEMRGKKIREVTREMRAKGVPMTQRLVFSKRRGEEAVPNPSLFVYRHKVSARSTTRPASSHPHLFTAQRSPSFCAKLAVSSTLSHPWPLFSLDGAAGKRATLVKRSLKGS